ncbi:adenosine kinase [Anaerobacterium chartisolvens]|uniref:Adenosine kinase n=1 Tax=Anaerobacterium chartisolvens TaxID=1297424 RepID=A0A369BEP2_9FIRM|nr:carbohydrate kinase family protein [Anaerobacterium chartisolvens]RCX20012.1 adenosine kinase [Anaerobacterium chartisolvens]
MKYDVITSGYVSLDRIIKTSTLVRYGYTSLIENSGNAKIHYGGCSSNISYLLARLGLNALPIIRVGAEDYTETGFYEYLKNGGVCLDAVESVPDETTSNSYLIADANNNHITIFYPGAMDGKYAGSLKDEFFQQARLGVMTVGSYEDNEEFYNKCMKHDVPLVFGMKCDFDAFPEKLFKKVMFSSKIIFTNQGEREEIERMFKLSSITELFEKGSADIIVTTLGKNGSVYFHKTNQGIISNSIEAAEFGKVIDTTGSGDAYMAGFLYGYLSGRHVEECCKLGSVLSSFIIEAVGCTTNAPTREELMDRYNKFILREGK